MAVARRPGFPNFDCLAPGCHATIRLATVRWRVVKALALVSSKGIRGRTSVPLLCGDGDPAGRCIVGQRVRAVQQSVGNWPGGGREKSATWAPCIYHLARAVGLARRGEQMDAERLDSSYMARGPPRHNRKPGIRRWFSLPSTGQRRCVRGRKLRPPQSKSPQLRGVGGVR